MDENEPIEEILEDIDRNQITIDMLVDKGKSIRDYQETLDMKVNHFEAIDKAFQGHNIRKLLWCSLKEWTAMVDEWESVAFEDIDVEEITELSDQYE